MAVHCRRKWSCSKFLTSILISVSIFAVIYPIFWLFYTSLKTDREIFSEPFTLPRIGKFQWSNYLNAWKGSQFETYFFNSVLVTIPAVIITTFLSAMAAYALSRFRFMGAKPIFFYFLAGLIVPLQLAIVPLFFQMRDLHLLNSRFGLVIAYMAFGFPFAVFVLTGFFRSLPSALHESALVDGANEFRAFFSVMLPLAKPGLTTVAIFSFIGVWNEFFLAFMFLSGEGSENIRTLPLGIANITIISQYRSD